MSVRNRSILLTPALLAVAGCAPTSHLAETPMVAAPAWSLQDEGSPAAGSADQPGIPADIATLLGSPELAGLVAQAQAQNPDIAAASAGIDRAAAILGAARLAALPSIALGGAAGREFGKDGSAFDFRSTSASLDVSWNLDPFGRISGPRRAALARLRAAEIQRDLIALSVETSVAQAFVLRASLARRIAILDQIIERAVELERVVRVRHEAGAATRVDLGQQAMRVTNLRRSRTELVESLDRTRTALAMLCGEEAPTFAPAPSEIARLALPDLGTPPPATLLAARPDVRAKEAIIAASNGDVRAARAAYFPSLNLSASGLLAEFSGGALSRSVTLGASVLAPIFDRGRLRAGMRVSEADQRAAVEDYRSTVFGALAEVENLQRTIAMARERAALVASITAEARLTARLARAQFIEGQEDLWTQIDAEQLLANAEDAGVLNLQERLLAEIALYRAMGGYRAWNVARR